MKITLKNGRIIAKEVKGKIYVETRYFKKINLALRDIYKYFIIVENNTLA